MVSSASKYSNWEDMTGTFDSNFLATFRLSINAHKSFEKRFHGRLIAVFIPWSAACTSASSTPHNMPSDEAPELIWRPI